MVWSLIKFCGVFPFYKAKGRIGPIEFSTVSIARRILYVTFYKLIFRFKPSGGWHGSSTMYLYHFENITGYIPKPSIYSGWK